jgi:hypothetical protein
MRMRPIYKTAVCLAHGWHGHHPSCTERGREPRRLVAWFGLFYAFIFYAFIVAPAGTSPVVR